MIVVKCIIRRDRKTHTVLHHNANQDMVSVLTLVFDIGRHFSPPNRKKSPKNGQFTGVESDTLSFRQHISATEREWRCKPGENRKANVGAELRGGFVKKRFSKVQKFPNYVVTFNNINNCLRLFK